MGHRHTQAVFDLKRRFGDNLILLRDRVGLSRSEMSVRSGLHMTQISLLERGLRLPRLDTIIKLAGALEVQPCELLVDRSARTLRAQAWILRADVAWRVGDVSRHGG